MVAASQMHEGTLTLVGETTAKGAGRASFYYSRALEIQARAVSLVDSHLHEVDRAWKCLNHREQILLGSKVFDEESFAEIARALNISKVKAYYQHHKVLDNLRLYVISHHRRIVSFYNDNFICHINTKFINRCHFLLIVKPIIIII
jgi:hypothetical protein